jgi:hypothetical protein
LIADALEEGIDQFKRAAKAVARVQDEACCQLAAETGISKPARSKMKAWSRAPLWVRADPVK